VCFLLRMNLSFSSVWILPTVTSLQLSCGMLSFGRGDLSKCGIPDYFYGNLLQISVKAPGRARGELEVTYLDDELR